MVELSIEEFELIHEEDLKGVFIFTNSNGCPLCENYLKSLKKYNTSEWMIIDIQSDEDKRWATVDMMVSGYPCTRVLYKDLTLYSRCGVLFDTQINEIYKMVNTNIPELDKM